MTEKQPSIFSRVNDSIAVFVTSIVGTMWCAYIFSIMVLLPLVYPNTNTVIQYISSAFLQLILLPLIMVGQTVQGRTTEQRARKDHKMIKAELQELRDMHGEINEILKEIKEKVS
jgi:uncharacterized membrane protein